MGITGVPFGGTELSIWHAMVPGAGFFKGKVTGSSFGIIFWFFPGRTKIEKIKMSRKWAPTIPKDAARLGDLGKRVFEPKFLKYG